MSGRLTQTVLHALDRASALLGHVARAAHLETGARGEEEAYFHLRRLGYVMVARNFRSPRHRSEVDMIGWEGETLCFIEVKTRSARGMLPAEASVDREKQNDLRAMARDYIRQSRTRAEYRFDIVSVYLEEGGPDITLFRNAFPVKS